MATVSKRTEAVVDRDVTSSEDCRRSPRRASTPKATGGDARAGGSSVFGGYKPADPGHRAGARLCGMGSRGHQTAEGRGVSAKTGEDLPGVTHVGVQHLDGEIRTRHEPVLPSSEHGRAAQDRMQGVGEDGLAPPEGGVGTPKRYQLGPDRRRCHSCTTQGAGQAPVSFDHTKQQVLSVDQWMAEGSSLAISQDDRQVSGVTELFEKLCRHRHLLSQILLRRDRGSP